MFTHVSTNSVCGLRQRTVSVIVPRAMRAWRERRSFREIVEGAPGVTAHLSADQIADAFNPATHQSNVDAIFERVGLA